MRSAIIGAALLGLAAANGPKDLHDSIDKAPSFKWEASKGVFHRASRPTKSKPAEPCAQVATGLKTSRIIPANLALACLRSVPLHKADGLTQLKGIKTFLNFQSSLAYLKDPPPGYLYPQTDILGGLDSITNNLNNGVYTNEYDFQLDIYQLIESAYDGHFQYVADIVGVFIWGYPTTLVSLSEDGLKLPEVYLQKDLNRTHDISQISPVSTISGVDVQKWLNQYASLNVGNQDPDTNYNSLFPVIPSGSGGSISATRNPLTEDMKVTLVNGTTAQFAASALTRKDFTNVTDGPSFFQKFCTNPKVTPTKTDPKPTQTPEHFVPLTPDEYTTKAAPDAFPSAIILASDLSIGGYFPENDQDTAVLAVSSFEPEDPVEFQNVVRRFLATAYDQNKSKLIVDLRGNPGGYVLLGYDMFEQIFPTKVPYGGTNFRAHQMFNDVGTIVSSYYQNVTDDTADQYNVGGDYYGIFNYHSDVQADGSAFTSWKQAYGPHKYHDDNFTSIIRWNISNPNLVGINITNFGPGELNYNNVTVFDKDNILLLQDGNCASTCTVFSEMMKDQGGVRQIAFGGRKQTGPMQGVGAIKGANIYSFSALANMISEAFDKDTNDHGKQVIAARYPNWESDAAQALKRAAQSSSGSRAASVNVRNQIRKDDDTVTPIQFIYEAADCRLFYTPDQIFDQSLVWSAAYNSIWGGAGCVDGSTNQPSSATLTGQPELIAAPDGTSWNSQYPDLTKRRPSDLN